MLVYSFNEDEEMGSSVSMGGEVGGERGSDLVVLSITESSSAKSASLRSLCKGDI